MSHRQICSRCSRFGKSCHLSHYYADMQEVCELRFVCDRCKALAAAARGDGAK